MDGGFTVHSIRSDTRRIHARLSDVAGTSVTVTFDRTDAAHLLYESDAFDAGRRASRWRVTRPLR